MQLWNTFQHCFDLSALNIDLVSSNTDECKLPLHSREKKLSAPNTQNAKHVIKTEQMTLTLVKYTTQPVQGIPFCVTQEIFIDFVNLVAKGKISLYTVLKRNTNCLVSRG